MRDFGSSRTCLDTHEEQLPFQWRSQTGPPQASPVPGWHYNATKWRGPPAPTGTWVSAPRILFSSNGHPRTPRRPGRVPEGKQGRKQQKQQQLQKPRIKSKKKKTQRRSAERLPNSALRRRRWQSMSLNRASVVTYRSPSSPSSTDGDLFRQPTLRVLLENPKNPKNLVTLLLGLQWLLAGRRTPDTATARKFRPSARPLCRGQGMSTRTKRGALRAASAVLPYLSEFQATWQTGVFIADWEERLSRDAGRPGF